MSKDEKLIARFLQQPTDFKYYELVRLFSIYGFIELNKGNTSGSRHSFWNEDLGLSFNIHKPHPDKGLKRYMMKQVTEFLLENEFIGK